MTRSRLILIFLSFYSLASCSDRETFREGSFIISSNQTKKISGLDLSITNNGCGRKWITEENKPGYEVPFCDLHISRGEKTIIAGNDYKPVYLGNVEVTLEKINPWNRTEDSIPPGGCKVHVKLREGR